MRQRRQPGRVVGVNGPPPLDPVQRAGLDVADQGADIAELGLADHRGVLGLDPHQPRQAVLLHQLPGGGRLGQLGLQVRRALGQQRRHVRRRQRRQERQRSLERGVILDRRGDEVSEPVVHLDPAGVGQPVDGPLGQPAFPPGLLRLNQPASFQRLDHPVQGAVVEPHALVLVPLPQGRGHLVRVPRLLGQADQDGQRERIGAIPGRHVPPPDRILGKEYPARSSVSNQRCAGVTAI